MGLDSISGIQSVSAIRAVQPYTSVQNAREQRSALECGNSRALLYVLQQSVEDRRKTRHRTRI